MENYNKVKNMFIALDGKEKLSLMRELMETGNIDAKVLLLIHLEWLQQKYNTQIKDIGTLANAGLSLGESTIKKAKSIKSEQKKTVIAAQTKSLLSTRVFEGTKFEKEMARSIEGIYIDEKWYEQSWKLGSTNQ